MASLASTPTLRAQRFIDANAESPLVYQGTDGDGCTLRLADERTFQLSTADCLSIRGYVPRWRHLGGCMTDKRKNAIREQREKAKEGAE